MPRRLRIAASVFFAVVTVALCVLWVRSYSWEDAFDRWVPHHQTLASQFGDLVYMDDRNTWQKPARGWRFRSHRIDIEGHGALWGVRVSHLYIVAVFGAVSAALFPFSTRFSLRALLIATTLVAVVLGLGVWAAG